MTEQRNSFKILCSECFCVPVLSVVLSQHADCGGEGRRGSESELQSDRLHQNTVEVEEEWGGPPNYTQ